MGIVKLSQQNRFNQFDVDPNFDLDESYQKKFQFPKLSRKLKKQFCDYFSNVFVEYYQNFHNFKSRIKLTEKQYKRAFSNERKRDEEESSSSSSHLSEFLMEDRDDMEDGEDYDDI